MMSGKWVYITVIPLLIEWMADAEPRYAVPIERGRIPAPPILLFTAIDTMAETALQTANRDLRRRIGERSRFLEFGLAVSARSHYEEVEISRYLPIPESYQV